MDLSTPITGQEMRPTRSSRPIGSCPWKRFFSTTVPMMHTALPAASSAGVKDRPEVSVMFCTSIPAAPMPWAVVDHFTPLFMATAPICRSPATAFTPPTCSPIASTSAAVKGRIAPAPAARPCELGRIIRVLAPSALIWVRTEAVTPLPTVTMVITAATPMTMPSTVRNDLSKCRRIARRARRRDAPNTP